MVQVQIGLSSGQIVELTPEEENKAQEVSYRVLTSGHSDFEGTAGLSRKRAEFLVNQAWRSAVIRQQNSDYFYGKLLEKQSKPSVTQQQLQSQEKTSNLPAVFQSQAQAQQDFLNTISKSQQKQTSQQNIFNQIFPQFANQQKSYLPVSQPLSQSLKQPPQKYISAYQPLTPQEKKNAEFYEKVYNKNSVVSKVGGAVGYFSNLFLEPYRDIKNLVNPPKTSSDTYEEAFGISGTSTTPTGKGTMTYDLTPYEELSPPAQYIRSSQTTEIPEVIKTQVQIDIKREELQNQVSSGEKSVEVANKELKQFSEGKISSYKSEAEKRNVALVKNIYGIDLKKEQPDFYSYERKLYDIGIPPSFIRPAVAGGTVGYGIYSGIKENPEKALLNLAVGAGITVGTAGLGSVGVPASIIKVGGYGLASVYGLEIASQISMQSGLYGKSLTAGEIIGEDVLPLVAGGKLGGYGVRRYTISKNLKTQIEALNEPDKTIFKKELSFAKTLSDVQPKVKELNLAGMERIPPKSRDIITEFLGKKNVVVGGSVAQRTQLYVPEAKAPSDIDVYTKGFFQEFKSKSYAKQLSNLLKEADIGRVSVSPSEPSKITIEGEKAIEFLPYNKYLRANLEAVLPFYKTSRAGITETPSGTKVLKLSYQLQRKLIGGYLDVARASKDLPSAEIIKKSLLETKKLQADFQVPLPLSAGIVEYDLTMFAKDLNIPFSSKTEGSRVKSAGGGGRGYSEYDFYSSPYFSADLNAGYPYGKIEILKTSYLPTSYKPSLINSYEPTTMPKSVAYSTEYTPKTTPITYEPTTTIYKPLVKKTTTKYNPEISYLPQVLKDETEGLFLFGKEGKMKKPTENIGYTIYTKKPKDKSFSKLLSKPLTKEDAQDTLFYTLDNSISRSGFIKPVKQKPKELGYNVPDDYFMSVQNKFRPYKIQLGKKKSISGYIEKGGDYEDFGENYLLDSVGERRQLSAFKSLSNLKRQNKINNLMGDLDVGLPTLSGKKKKSIGKRNDLNFIMGL